MSGALTIRIDTLAFPGLSAIEARRAAGAFEEELAELLQRHGPPPGVTAADLERIDLGALAATGTADAMGRELAQKLWRRLTP